MLSLDQYFFNKKTELCLHMFTYTKQSKICKTSNGNLPHIAVWKVGTGHPDYPTFN